MYNSGKPWGKYGAVYYQQHVVNWRELLVWIHRNRIDIDHNGYTNVEKFKDHTMQQQIEWLQLVHQSGRHWMSSYTKVDKHRYQRVEFMADLEMIF